MQHFFQIFFEGFSRFFSRKTAVFRGLGVADVHTYAGVRLSGGGWWLFQRAHQFTTAPYGPSKLKTVIAADEIWATASNNQKSGRKISFENLTDKPKSRPLAEILTILQ